MNKIPNNSHQGPAASAASGVNKIGFWPAKDCLYPKRGTGFALAEAGESEAEFEEERGSKADGSEGAGN